MYDRIKLMFGDTYGLEISSFENIGTMVKYRLPIIDGTEPVSYTHLDVYKRQPTDMTQAIRITRE